MTDVDALVIGGGQSGLAAAHALRKVGRAPVLLEAGPEPVGSWPSYYDSLTLFSPARYSTLPGMAFPADPWHYPHRDEVIDYLRRYAKNLDADIRTDHREFLRSVALSGGHDARRYVDVYDSWLQARSLGACKALDPLPDDIVAWDVVRAVFIIRASVTAGYLTPDEGWPLLRRGLAIVQARYATWRQMSQAYLAGFAFWHASHDLAQTASMVATRTDQILRLHEAPFSPWRRVALRPGTPVLTLDPSHQALKRA